MCSAFDEANNVPMIERCGHFDLAHKTTERLIRHCDFRQQGLDCDVAAIRLITRKHYAAHSAASQHLYHLVTGDGLRTALEFFAALLTNECQCFARCGLGSIAPPAVHAFHRYHYWSGERRRAGNICGYGI